MRKLVVLMGLGASVSALGIWASGCDSTSCDETETCPPSGSDGSADSPSDHAPPRDAPHDGKSDGMHDAGGEGSTGEGGKDGGCNLSQAPSQDNCVLQDGDGVFVAPAPYGN